MAAVILVSGCAEPPDFKDIHGEGYRYEAFADKWVVVNYWATWCAPCIKEIPELNTLAAEHGDDVVVLGVNWDAPLEDEMITQAEKMRIEFPVYAGQPHEQLGVEKPEVLPTTYIFAPGLELAETLVGPQTEASILAVMGMSPGDG